MAKRDFYRRPKTRPERASNDDESHRPYVRAKRRSLPTNWDDIQNGKTHKEHIVIRRWIRSKQKKGLSKDEALPFFTKKFPKWETKWFEFFWKWAIEDSPPQ